MSRVHAQTPVEGLGNAKSDALLPFSLDGGYFYSWRRALCRRTMHLRTYILYDLRKAVVEILLSH